MLLIVSGYANKGDFKGEMIEILVLCEQSVYPCNMQKSEWSITTYLRKYGNVIVKRNKDNSILKNDNETYFHICGWDITLSRYKDVTIDFFLSDIAIEIRADDYNEFSIAQETEDSRYEEKYGCFKDYNIFKHLDCVNQFEDWGKSIDVADALKKISIEDEEDEFNQRIASYKSKLAAR